MRLSRPFLNLAGGVVALLGVCCSAFQGVPLRCSPTAPSSFTSIKRFAGAKSQRSPDGHMPVVHFVTSNKQKLREVEALLAEGKLDVPFRLEALDVTLPELQDDPTVIAIEKARLAARHVGGPVLVEDTSLCFTALNELPGPYIKWFLEGLGNQGLFNLLAPYEDKTAFAACNVAFSAGPDDEPVVFCGKTYGTIVAPDGDAGFGWDGIFKPAGFDVTFARMTLQEKNAISHRSLALRQFQEYIRKANSFSSSSIMVSSSSSSSR